jgi:hypothetical protein
VIVGLIVIALLGVAVVGLVLGTVTEREYRVHLLQIHLGAYGLRLFLFETVMRRVAFFSHGVAGGDCEAYQEFGSLIARYWRVTHVHFVTHTEMPVLGQASLPCNILAVFEYLGGEPSPLGGTACNAFLASWTTLMVYRFVRDAGADAAAAERVMLLVLFGPSFLYHTSDCYKDGLNAFLVVASLINAARIAQRFSGVRLAYLATSLFFLWFVRHYMVFMCLAPLTLGFLGTGRASIPRRLAAGVMLIVVVAGLYYSGSGDRAIDTAAETYELATNANTMGYNIGQQGGAAHASGSGVVTSSYFEAVLYVVAAPFPWQFGSIGFQLGKLEALILYWFFYVIYRERRRLWKEHRPTLLMMAAFIIPATLAYAATVANVGLIVRQRMPIVIAVAILAGLAYRTRTARAGQRSGATRGSPILPATTESR